MFNENNEMCYAAVEFCENDVCLLFHIWICACALFYCMCQKVFCEQNSTFQSGILFI